MIMRKCPMMVLLLSLAACGGSETATPANSQADTAAVETAPPANDSAGEAAEATPPFAEVEGAHPTAPEPAPIPAAFRGIWAESKALCGDLAHPNRLVVSGATLRFPDFVVRTDDVRQLGPREIAIKGVVEGKTQKSDHHYFIDAAGETLTDGAGGGAVRVRCTS